MNLREWTAWEGLEKKRKGKNVILISKKLKILEVTQRIKEKSGLN